MVEGQTAERTPFSAQLAIDLYTCGGWSIRQIADHLRIERNQLGHLLKQAGVAIAPKGAGRPRPRRRMPDRPDLSSLLEEFYVRRRLPAESVGRLLGLSAATVRSRLRRYGFGVRTKGWASREDRRIVCAAEAEELYCVRRLSADEVARVLGTHRRVILRMAHDQGWPVRLGGNPPRSEPSEIQLIAALYEDGLVRAVLRHHGIPLVPAGGPIWQRFPRPVNLTCDALRDLYDVCGITTQHIELLTGHPAQTVAGRLRSNGIALRPRGGRSPFLRRWRSAPRRP